MGRRLQARVPKTSHRLEPAWPPSVPFAQRDQANKIRQASNFNWRHVARALRTLQAGEQVWVRNTNCPATAMGPAQCPQLVRCRDAYEGTPVQPDPPCANNGKSRRMHHQPIWHSHGGTDSHAHNAWSSSNSLRPENHIASGKLPNWTGIPPRVSRFCRRIRRSRRLDLCTFALGASVLPFCFTEGRM